MTEELFPASTIDLADGLGNLAADDPRLAYRWPGLLVEMIDVLGDRYVRSGMDKGEAASLARLAITALAQHFGGRPFYLPRGDRLKRALRDAQIWDEFTGDNVFELAERHRLTPKQIYEILAEQRKWHRARVQTRLFG